MIELRLVSIDELMSKDVDGRCECGGYLRCESGVMVCNKCGKYEMLKREES